jgi:hypothetical protein
VDKEWRPIDDRVGGKSRKINPMGRGDREGDAPQKSKNQKSRIKNQESQSNFEEQNKTTMGAATKPSLDVCAACGKGSVGKKLKSCAGCKEVKYCSVGECVEM